jgi:hypothetical protein
VAAFSILSSAQSRAPFLNLEDEDTPAVLGRLHSRVKRNLPQHTQLFWHFRPEVMRAPFLNLDDEDTLASQTASKNSQLFLKTRWSLGVDATADCLEAFLQRARY